MNILMKKAKDKTLCKLLMITIIQYLKIRMKKTNILKGLMIF